MGVNKMKEIIDNLGGVVGNWHLIVGEKSGVSRIIAYCLAAQLHVDRRTLGIAGGSSTDGICTDLRKNGADLTKFIVFTPDELFGTNAQQQSIRGRLPGATVYSPEAAFDPETLDKLGLDSAVPYKWENELTDFLEGRSKDPRMKVLAGIMAANCNNYEALIKEKGGIDILLLGMGEDGHVASIMPGDVAVNGQTYLQRYPKQHEIIIGGKNIGQTWYAVTIGMGTILQAKEIFLIAYGDKKADALEKALYGPISGSCPASLLRSAQQSPPRIVACFDYAAGQKIL